MGLKLAKDTRPRPDEAALNRTSVGLKQLYPPPWRHCPESLNRTSVGLKRLRQLAVLALVLALNRTSVGLKLTISDANKIGRLWPQSNQRGIETECHVHRVGRESQPQSNQRGIETDPQHTGVDEHGQGLNRTSVGLKLVADNGDEGLEGASIEPAWD